MIKINDVVIEALELLPDDTRINFYPAIFDYILHDKVPSFTGTDLAIWTLIKGYLKKAKPKATADHDAILADAETMTQAQIAKKYGLSQSTVNRILKKKPVAVEKPVEAEKIVAVEKPVAAEKPVVAEKTDAVEKPAVTLGVYDSMELPEDWMPDSCLPEDIQHDFDEINGNTFFARQQENESQLQIEAEAAALAEFFSVTDYAEPAKDDPEMPDFLREPVEEKKPVAENKPEEKPVPEAVDAPHVVTHKHLTTIDQDADTLFTQVFYNAYCDARNEHINLRFFNWNDKPVAVSYFKALLSSGLKVEQITELINDAIRDNTVIKLGCSFADLKNYINKHKKEVEEYEIY